ncbi:MAG: fibronectin type III domain-containing protein [Chloroflexi bacterium]|nr:fibronectin type III domain-containing protein [Chloroflexota bacterium]
MKRIKIHMCLLFSAAVALLIGWAPAGAQGGSEHGEVSLAWSAYDPGDASLQVWYWIALQVGDDSLGKKTQATSAAFTGLTAGTSYPYQIDAYACTPDEASGYTADATIPDCATVQRVDAGAATARDTSGSIRVSWSRVADPEGGTVWYWVVTADDDEITTSTSATFDGLEVGQRYGWHVDVFSCIGEEAMPNCPRIVSTHDSGTAIATGGRARVRSGGSGSGGSRDDDASVLVTPTPSFVDHSVTVSGGALHQPLTLDGIGHRDIIALGVISATNVWGSVPPGTRVCFVGRGGGGVMFKDSSITPHPLEWLAHFLVGNDTCVDLPGAGTVVLVEQGGPYADVLPPLDALNPPICQIKLTQTLLLRATPGGEIIRPVWLNSEVPVFAIVEGQWYMIEFEGQVGYVSRYYRKVLRGAC